MIYPASRTHHAPMWLAHRSSGVPLAASWIDLVEAEDRGQGQEMDFTGLWTSIEAEIRSSDALVLFARTDDFPLKGALVEVGLALGMGKPVMLVLPGVDIELPSHRPIGSWINHPGVTVEPDLDRALALALSGTHSRHRHDFKR